MEQRIRSRSRTTGGGTIRYPGPSGPIVQGPQVIEFRFDHTTDFWKKKRRYLDPTGSGLPPSNFTSHSVFRKFDPLNGGVNDSFFWYTRWGPGGVINNPCDHISLDGKDRGNDAYVLRLLRRSNPLRSTYSVPVAIKELVDLTTLFKFAAGSIAGFFGNTYLNYRFGWLSLLSDIQILEQLVKVITSRLKEINSLRMTGGLRRKVDLDAFGAGQSGYFDIHSTFGLFITDRYDLSTNCKVWGSVHWYPRGGDITLFPTEPAEQWLLAVRQVLDLESIDPLTAWELIPWSWLVDYFASVSDFFAAYEGRTLIEPVDICIMREFTTIARGTRVPSGTIADNVRGGAFYLRRVSKFRTVIANAPAFPQIFGTMLSVSEFKIVTALLAKFRG